MWKAAIPSCAAQLQRLSHPFREILPQDPPYDYHTTLSVKNKKDIQIAGVMGSPVLRSQARMDSR